MSRDVGMKHPVRPINQEILSHLELVDNKIRPLPGATGPRPTGLPDSRLSQLTSMSGVAGLSDEICFYEHLATVRYRDPNNPRNDQFFVAFRQTMDALLIEQSDPIKYPEHLMKDPVKKTELRVHIYFVKELPSKLGVINSIQDWLEHIGNDQMFDTIAHFLLKNNVITEEMYGRG